ncbi:thioredoxin domain-containing protein EC-YbbN [alpha proteobacterium U9-1i]|nr:thioredoxin domain-containing protein EC-YbbN [alpha proteobacterium U9-1i]
MTFMDAAAATDPIKDGTDQGFMADVIEPSREAPVIVDFWAPWCGPCRTLQPALEKAVRAAKGKVRLVKINIDENPGVAGQLGVRSIPAVYAFDKGRPVDGFMGAIPESQIKLFVDKLAGADMSADLEEFFAQAAESLALNDFGGAAQGFAQVLQIDPENVKALAGMARVYLLTGEPEQAREILDVIPLEKANDPDVAGVRAALDLAAQAGGGDDTSALLHAVRTNPADHQARFDLAGALAAKGDLAGAADELLAIIEAKRDWNEDAARLQLLKIFEAAGAMSDVAKNGRRRLSALLFS